MTGAGALTYLKELCHQIDEGIDHTKLRKIVVTLAIPAVTFTASCDSPVVYEVYGAPEYGGPFEETDCNNGIDEDDDGRIDCDDFDCRGVEVCLGCFDGIDNEDNGAADCDDSTCGDSEACIGDCDDGLDDDGDGRTDCDDPDCAGSPACP